MDLATLDAKRMPTRLLRQILGLTQPRFAQLVSEGILLRSEERGWQDATQQIPRFYEWRFGIPQQAPDTEATVEARARYERARADEWEIRVAERSGEVVQRELVTERFVAAASAFTRALNALPGRLATAIAGERDAALVRQLLQRECHEARRLAIRELEVGNVIDGAHPADSGAAADEARPPVGGRVPRAAARKRRARQAPAGPDPVPATGGGGAPEPGV